MMRAAKPASARRERRAALRPTRKVVIVNGTTEAVAMLESTLEGGHFDVVFVESSASAYSRVRRVQPQLVVLCLDEDDAEGLRVLSMLKLDDATRRIPVVTLSAGAQEADEPEPDPARLVTAPTALVMN